MIFFVGITIIKEKVPIADQFWIPVRPNLPDFRPSSSRTTYKSTDLRPLILPDLRLSYKVILLFEKKKLVRL